MDESRAFSRTTRNSIKTARGGFTFALLLCLMAGGTTARAQEAQSRQFQQMRPQQMIAPTSAAGVVKMEDDEEIGRQFLLKRRVAVPQFSATADVQEYYTSNRLLVDSDTQGDFVFVGTAGAAWNPTWIPNVQASLYARQQFFRYSDLSDLDFDATTFGFSAGGAVKDWFNLAGGYNVTRLTTRGVHDEFYKEGDATLMISRTQMFGQRVGVPYGYTIDFFHATPSDFTRITHGLFAGVNWVLSDKWLLQFLYRFQIEDYVQVTRDDHAHILSAAATYHFTPWASARAFVSWTMNDSTEDRDYDVFNGGAGVNVLVRF